MNTRTVFSLTFVVTLLYLMIGTGYHLNISSGYKLQENHSVELRQADLDFLVHSLKSWHPDLFFHYSEKDFNSAVASLESRLSTLTDDQMFIEFAKLVALIKDAHTFLFPFQEATGFQIYPLRLYYFDDGLFVIDALPSHTDLIGSQIISVGNLTTDQAYDILGSTISHDNENTIKLIAPIRFLIPEILQALGIIESNRTVFGLKTPAGLNINFEPSPISYDDYRNWIDMDRSDLLISRSFDEITILSGLLESDEPLYLSKRNQENFWYTYIETTHTLYIQYNFVLSTTPDGATISQFVREIVRFLEENFVDKVIVDLRHNPGGNNNSYKPFLDFLSQNEKFSTSGHLFTIIGRNTFSAATNFATDLEQLTNAIFIGEGTGGSPNLYGDPTSIILPNSRLSVQISTRYWEKSSPDDTCTSIEPDYDVGLSAEEYFEKNDPQLDFILEEWSFEVPETSVSGTLLVGNSVTSTTQSTSSDTSGLPQTIRSILSAYLIAYVLIRPRSDLKNRTKTKPF